MRQRIQWTRSELWARRCVVGFFALLTLLAICFSLVKEPERNVLAPGSDVQVRMADLKPGKLHLLSYAIDPSTTTRLAIQRGEDGALRVAFGSCRNCRSYRHYEWSSKLVCGHCNHSINLPNADERPAEKADCKSVAIPYALKDEHLIVQGTAITEEFRRWYSGATVIR